MQKSEFDLDSLGFEQNELNRIFNQDDPLFVSPEQSGMENNEANIEDFIPSQVRMVQLFLNSESEPKFKYKNKSIDLENIQTNWTGKGAVCFGKNEVWFSAAENLAPGGTPDLVLYICPTSSEKDFCDVDTNGEPNRYNKYLYEIEWSIFGNLTLSRYYFRDKVDPKNGEWIEQ